MKLGDVKDYAVIAAVAGAAFAVYKLLGKVPEGLTKAGEAVGGAVFNLFHPDPTGTMYYYIVKFAGGEQHAIPKQSKADPNGVDSAGRFTFRGKQFVIRDRPNGKGGVEHWAFNP